MAPSTLKNQPQSLAIGSKLEAKNQFNKDNDQGKEDNSKPKLEGQNEHDEHQLFGFSAKPLNSKAALDQQGRLKPKAFVQSSYVSNKNFKLRIGDA